MANWRDTSMICVSLAEPTPARCLAALAGIPFAEIRLERMRTGEEGVGRVFSSHPRLIATCRPGRFADSRRLSLLRAAISAGAAFVDIEVEAGASYKRALVREARASGCDVIVSYHDLERTPSRGTLAGVVDRCFASGANIAKIACRIRSPKDNARLLGLQDDDRALVVVGLGKMGAMTRVMGPLAGGLFSFASLARGRETAGGQIPHEDLARLIRMAADA
jgi:3-dehydroquinate dehydratase-1